MLTSLFIKMKCTVTNALKLEKDKHKHKSDNDLLPLFSNPLPAEFVYWIYSAVH
jgi:hypothetical protein